MDIENQVCSLELSQKLLTLWVNQNSIFYYLNIDGKGKYYIYDADHLPDKCEYEGDEISAFTVGELGEMLPAYIQDRGGIFNLSGYKSKCLVYQELLTGYVLFPVSVSIKGDTEADARAAMLIYLLENGIIKNG